MRQNAQSIFEIPAPSNGLNFLMLILFWSWTFSVLTILRGEEVMVFPASSVRLLTEISFSLIAFLRMIFRLDGGSLLIFGAYQYHLVLGSPLFGIFKLNALSQSVLKKCKT